MVNEGTICTPGQHDLQKAEGMGQPEVTSKHSQVGQCNILQP